MKYLLVKRVTDGSICTVAVDASELAKHIDAMLRYCPGHTLLSVTLVSL